MSLINYDKSSCFDHQCVQKQPGPEKNSQAGPKKFFVPGSKTKFSKFPVDQLQNLLQLEALYLMFFTLLKAQDDSIYCMRRWKRLP